MKKTNLSSHLLVLLQFISITLSLLPITPFGYRTYFLLLTLFGLILGVLTLMHNQIGNFRVYPEIKHGSRLIINGPYRFIRHPMYTSLILTITGASSFLNHPVNYIGLTGVIVAVLMKAKKEEQLLLAQYPEYKKYINRTRGFIPFLI